MKPHPQVQRLLEAVANSPFPALSTVSPFVARRLYAERCRIVRPAAPEVPVRLLMTSGGIVMRSYRPAAAAKDDLLPALVFFHGGGWTIGDLDTHDTLCRQLAHGAGCAVFSVDYRLAPEHPFPTAIDDALAATRWLVAQAGALGVGVLESFGSFWASAFKEVIVFTSILPILLWRSLRDPHRDDD